MQFYMAKVPSGQTAETWDGSGSVWFKIYQEEAITTSSSISWASMGKTQYPVTLPKALPAGEYLLRSEHIALHSAGSSGGAQVSLATSVLVMLLLRKCSSTCRARRSRSRVVVVAARRRLWLFRVRTRRAMLVSWSIFTTLFPRTTSPRARLSGRVEWVSGWIPTWCRMRCAVLESTHVESKSDAEYHNSASLELVVGALVFSYSCQSVSRFVNNTHDTDFLWKPTRCANHTNTEVVVERAGWSRPVKADNRTWWCCLS